VSGPLDGVRVLDLSRILAGPYATQILGDLGADVIKVEHPAGDDTRRWGPPFWGSDAVYYLAANRNKRSRVLDFADAADLAEVHHLADGADVVVENFKVGSLCRFGLDYQSLSARNPDLVYCSITGFGQEGPYSDQPGYDALIQAMGGVMSITGPDASTPTKVGVAVADITCGLYAVIGILSALWERRVSGKGQRLDLSLLDVQTSWLANVAMSFLVTGDTPAPLGNAHPTIVPYQSFATADRPLMLAVGNDTQFAALSRVLDESWHEDPRFATNPARVEHRAELVEALERRLTERPRDHWIAAFSGAGIPCGPVNDLSDLAADPHVAAHGLFTRMDDGTTPCLASPLRLSRSGPPTYRRPPHLGEHPDADWQ